MDSRSFMAPTSSPDTSAAGGSPNNVEPSYPPPLYRYPPHTGYATNAPFSPDRSSVGGNTFTKAPKYPAAAGSLQSPLNASPASSAYSSTSQFRGTSNGGGGSAFGLGGYSGGFYGAAQQQATVPSTDQLPQHAQSERHASSGSNNTSESNSFTGVSFGAPSTAPAAAHHHHPDVPGPIQQNIHAN